jgi:uncharacterized sporulation protein YeaH/YhbH (DUF444 family)
MSIGTKKISARFSAELVTFLEGEVEDKARRQIKSDLSREIVIAVRQRQISLLSKADRVKLYRRLGVDSNEELIAKEEQERKVDNGNDGTGDLFADTQSETAGNDNGEDVQPG